MTNFVSKALLIVGIASSRSDDAIAKWDALAGKKVGAIPNGIRSVLPPSANSALTLSPTKLDGRSIKVTGNVVETAKVG